MTDADYMHITLVVDPEFGEHAKTQSALGPLWVIESARNTPVIEEIWAGGKPRFVDSPTSFVPAPGISAEKSALISIGPMSDHYPDWKTFEIIGVPLSPALLDALQDCAPGSVRETPIGFIFTRTDR